MGTKQYERIFQILGAVLLAAVVVGVIAVCFGNGARSGVKREIGASDYYSQEEISAAMDTAQEYFDDHFPGCVMTAFRYDEESVREAEPGMGRSVSGRSGNCSSVRFSDGQARRRRKPQSKRNLSGLAVGAGALRKR